MGDSPCWRFSGAEDERIEVEVNKLSGDFDLHVATREPDGRSAGTSFTTGSGLNFSEWLTPPARTRCTCATSPAPTPGSYDIAIND